MHKLSRLAWGLCALVLLCGSAGRATAQETLAEAADVTFHLDDASLPDPKSSPGEWSTELVAEDLCDIESEAFARKPPKTMCDELFAAGGTPESYRFQYACVFVVPPAIGGTQSRQNVWLQPVTEAPVKAKVDAAARKHICRNPADLPEAQRLLAKDWVGAYRRYLLPGDQLAPIIKADLVPNGFEHTTPPVDADATPVAPCGGNGSSAGVDAGSGGATPDERQRRQHLLDDRN